MNSAHSGRALYSSVEKKARERERRRESNKQTRNKTDTTPQAPPMSYSGKSLARALGVHGSVVRRNGARHVQLRNTAAAARLFYSTDAKTESKHKPAADAADAAAEDDEYYVDVSDLDKRWPSLAFEAQQDIISYLNVKQEFDWRYLSPPEKRAIHYIAYGPWGARDTKVMTGAEFVFKLMTNMLLFSVLGFSMLNYAVDQEKIADLEHSEQPPQQ